jgi:hypothetical protein
MFGAQVQAQENTGSIVGKVTSAAGPVQDATVTAKNLGTGRILDTTTGDTGSYRITKAPVGTYEITTTADGFETFIVIAEVGLGEGTTVSPMMQEAGYDEIIVTSEAVAPIDVSSAETTTVITAADVDRLPLQRDVNAIALVAPGAVQGDQSFGGLNSQDRQHYSTRATLVSFGGASVGENTYFINGFNVTNFRNGLGGGALPFHFYDQFQLKTGGFGAEFGRSTGGVINAITKSGGNEWEMGGGAYFEPADWQGESPDVLDRNGDLASRKKGDQQGGYEAYVYASGPVIKDRLFAYVTYTARDYTRENFTTSQFNDDEDSDPFWGAKIDWLINDDHSLELTAFSDKHTTNQQQFAFDPDTNTVGESLGGAVFRRGGDVTIVRYSGHLTDNFSISALYGTSEYDVDTNGENPLDTCPTIFDVRGASTLTPGCWTVQIPESGVDERDAFRIDAEWFLGDRHLVRVGFDSEETTSSQLSHYGCLGCDPIRTDTGEGLNLNGGGIRFFYSNDSSSSTGERVQVRELLNAGNYTTNTDAWYIEDEWTVTDTVTMRLGLRNERFENLNKDGEGFIKITDQWAPRFGISWDVGGNGTYKLFFNAGRYHLPIPSNTNVRLAGDEYFSQQNFELLSVNDDGTPVIGTALSSLAIFSDGTILDPLTVLDTTIDPMYQDEYILGYERELWGGDWVGSIVGTYRDMKSTIEDVTIDAAIGEPFLFHYILTNPGTPVNTFFDLDGDGVAEEYNFTAEEMGFPKAKRSYSSVTLRLERPWDGKFYLNASYTWAHSYGNTEGFVRSDNGQDDAGITTLYDFPGLMDYADGNLPNDRRHSFKAGGTWQFAENWQVGTFASIQSGRPKNAFGVHPTDPFSYFYEDESYYNRGEPAPRGSLGRTPTIYNIDLSLKYLMDFNNGTTLTARLDVFNVFDFDEATEVDESSDEGSSCPPTNTVVCDPDTGFYGDNPAFHTAIWHQTPRTIRLGFTLDFGT